MKLRKFAQKLATLHANDTGRFNANLDSVAMHGPDYKDNIVRNPNLLSYFSGKYQHLFILLRSVLVEPY